MDISEHETNPFVRVKDKVTGHEYSVRTSAVDNDRHDVIDKPAFDESFDPLPAKPNVPKGDAKNHREAPRPAAPSQVTPTPASEPNTKE